MDEAQVQSPPVAATDLPSAEPVISREQALREFEAIMLPDAQERVLHVQGEGGLGKTWFLKDVQRYCEENNLLYNVQIIDFYDTHHHRVSGLIASIIHELDSEYEFFGSYHELRSEFDRLRALGFGGRKLDQISDQMDCAFFAGLQELGAAHRQADGGKGVVLLLDTFEVVRDGRVGHWVLDDLLGSTRDIRSKADKPPAIVATQDIAVVIAGRPPALDQNLTEAQIRHCCPGAFDTDEIERYIQEAFQREHREDLSQALAEVTQLAAWIEENTGGHPVQVALAVDYANLHVTTYGDSQALTGGELLEALRELEGQHNLSVALIEGIMELLLGRPEQQWAVLYMAHLRRRFTLPMCATLMDKLPADMGSLERAFSDFEMLYMTKYRRLRGSHGQMPDTAKQADDVTISLHDLIRDWVHERYWQGSIPLVYIDEGRNAGVFPKRLDELWEEICDWQGEQEEIPHDRLEPIRNWLDDTAIEFYESQRLQLEAQRSDLDKEQEPSRWVELEYQRNALMAELLLYAMDRNLEPAWRSWRQSYYRAFEAYQQGYCEQLELTVLSAWSSRELAEQARFREIRKMVQIRQGWWKIRHSDQSREAVVHELDGIVREDTPLPEGEYLELLADAHAALGWARALEGKTRLAREHRTSAVRIRRTLRQDWDLTTDLNFLGEACHRLGLFHRADEAWREAIQIASRLKDQSAVASIAMSWGHSLHLRGETGRALGYAKVAETLFREMGDTRRLGYALNNQGRIYQALGKYLHAERALDESQVYSNRLGHPHDRASLLISWGEFYRHRAQSSQPGDRGFQLARDALEAALEIASEEGLGDSRTRAIEELGCLARDQARITAASGLHEQADRLWDQAEEALRLALENYREQDSGFKMADLLDDLCELYMDRYHTDGDILPTLEQLLEELEATATERNCPLHLARVAERRAELAWLHGELEKAVRQYVSACSHVSLHTKTGETFRTSYDRLLGRLEEQLNKVPGAEDRAKLADLAQRLWGQTGHAASHPQFSQACRRVLYPAQAQLEETAADKQFEQGRLDYADGKVGEALQQFHTAFRRYVTACDRMGRLTDGSFESYDRYMALVGKLERRFYDLPDFRLARDYSEEVQEAWLRLEHAERHPAVLEVCQRASDMAELVQRLTLESASC
jgi:tetratricopeptide (TPR) repeat protein